MRQRESLFVGFCSPARWDSWQRIGEARGQLAIPPGKIVRLDVSREAPHDLSALRNLPPDAVQMLILSRTDATDDVLPAVAHLTGLEILWLDGTSVTGAGLSLLGSLAKLKELNLTHTAIGDAGAAHLLALPSLQSLTLSHTRITDNALETFSRMPQIETTKVRRTGSDGLSSDHHVAAHLEFPRDRHPRVARALLPSNRAPHGRAPG